MDKHYLTPLFQPESIAVFAGNHEDPDSQIPHARALCAALTDQRFTGNLVFLDIHTSGTLADLAQTRADLAIIALPPAEALSALTPLLTTSAARHLMRPATSSASTASPGSSAMMARSARVWARSARVPVVWMSMKTR